MFFFAFSCFSAVFLWVFAREGLPQIPFKYHWKLPKSFPWRFSLSSPLGWTISEEGRNKSEKTNPVDGNHVTIKSPIGGDKYVELFDINGRRVLSTIISGDMLDVSSINTGFYMVEVTINGYKKVSKLIIE